MEGKPDKASASNITRQQPPQCIDIFTDFDGFSSRGWLQPILWELPIKNILQNTFITTIPDIDVIEHDHEIIVKANMPGVEKKDIDVSLTKERVTIKGKMLYEEKEEKGDYFYSEIAKGTYIRTLILPATIDKDKAKAKYSDGVLELTLLKTEAARRKNVKID